MTLPAPCDPDLHGMFEADLARQQVNAQCGLRHHQSNKNVGKQVDPYLFDHRDVCLATQAFHPKFILMLRKSNPRAIGFGKGTL